VPGLLPLSGPPSPSSFFFLLRWSPRLLKTNQHNPHQNNKNQTNPSPSPRLWRPLCKTKVIPLFLHYLLHRGPHLVRRPPDCFFSTRPSFFSHSQIRSLSDRLSFFFTFPFSPLPSLNSPFARPKRSSHFPSRIRHPQSAELFPTTSELFFFVCVFRIHQFPPSVSESPFADSSFPRLFPR